MPFDWQELLEVARTLERDAVVGAANVEAKFRSAANRAYFGAFCHARNYAQAYLNFQPRRDQDDHGRLRAHLKGKHKGNRDRLERLRQWRNEADYYDDLPWQDVPARVAAAIKEAQDIFNSLTPPASSSGS